MKYNKEEIKENAIKLYLEGNNITEISKLNLFSKKLEIRYNSTKDYTYNEDDNSITVYHNFNR